jgi:regulator of sigma E protease
MINIVKHEEVILMLVSAFGNDFVLAVIAFALILIPAIIIHELGHFFAAKIVGINVLEFGIGFPPRVGRLFMWGETEFTINLLPIGGFVRPLGEDMIGPVGEEKMKRDRETIRERYDDDEVVYVTEREELRDRGIDDADMMSVNEAPALGRIFFMAAGALANFATAIVLFFVVALIGLPTVVGGLSQVVSIPDGSIFDNTEVSVGDAVEKINGIHYTDFDAFYDELAGYVGQDVELSMLRNKTGESYDVTVTVPTGLETGYVQITGVQEDSPAFIAGIEAGDLVTHIDGNPIPASGSPSRVLQEATIRYEGRAMPLVVLRQSSDGTLETLELVVTPRVNPPDGAGRLGVLIRSQFGIGDNTRFADAGLKSELVPQDIPSAISHSIQTTANTFQLIASVPARLLDGSLSGEDARPISIIGISKIGGEFIQRSLQEGPGLLLNFIALISIFLGVSNLLPIPALDGGRIVFVLIEMLRGKPIDPQIEGRIHQIGIMILLALGVLVMIYDVINPPSIS